MVPLHEPLTVGVTEDTALAAQRLSNQECARLRMVERGRVELYKLHVGDGGAGSPGHRQAVTSGDRRIGGVLVDLTASSRGEQCRFRLDRATVAGFLTASTSVRSHSQPV